MLPYLNRLVLQLWNTSNGIFQTRHKARVELNFIEYSDSKRYYSEPDVVVYKKGSRPQYACILGTETLKELGIVLDLKAKTTTIDEIILPMRDTNHLQGAGMLSVLKLNYSLAMELKSIQEATKCETWILYTKYNKADLQSIVKDIANT